MYLVKYSQVLSYLFFKVEGGEAKNLNMIQQE